MHLREFRERLTAIVGELESYDSRVVPVRKSPAETRSCGTVDQLYDAMCLKQEVTRRLADGRPSRVVMALDREKQLMLRGGQASSSSELLALVEEPAELGTEEEQVPVLPVAEVSHARARPTLDRPGGADRVAGFLRRSERGPEGSIMAGLYPAMMEIIHSRRREALRASDELAPSYHLRR